MDRRALIAGLPLAAAGCAPSLGTFDALAPRDRGGRRIVRDAAYGAHARQRLDIYAPRQQAGPAPVLVFFHGGSWRSGDKADYEFLGAAFAARGFLTVLPNYRLVPEVRFPDFVEDCARAVRWTVDHATEHGGNGRRIVFAGHSAGAYNAIMLALDAHYLQEAGVEPTHIRGAAGLAGPYDFLPFDVEATRDAFGQAPEPAITQPVHFARADAPPLLLLWGEDDATVGQRSVQGLERAMRSAGGGVATKIYRGVGHVEILLALSRPFRGVAPVLDDVTAFTRRVTA
jgi:acetyl esterase/lipase